MRHTITIYADGDLETLADLRLNVAIAEEAAAEAKAAATRRLGDTTEDEDAAVRAAKDAYDAGLDAAAERANAWTVESIGHEEFRELLKAHPPRKVDADPVEGEQPKQVTHPEDEALGVNTETFGKALLLYVDPEDPEIRTIVEPTENVPRQVKRLSSGQFETLWVAAYQVNVGGVLDPKATRFSIAPTSSAT
jgi:hypothetical protein